MTPYSYENMRDRFSRKCEGCLWKLMMWHFSIWSQHFFFIFSFLKKKAGSSTWRIFYCAHESLRLWSGIEERAEAANEPKHFDGDGYSASHVTCFLLLFLYFITSFFLKVFPLSYPPQASHSSLRLILLSCPNSHLQVLAPLFTWSYGSDSIYHSFLSDLIFFFFFL